MLPGSFRPTGLQKWTPAENASVLLLAIAMYHELRKDEVGGAAMVGAGARVSWGNQAGSGTPGEIGWGANPASRRLGECD